MSTTTEERIKQHLYQGMIVMAMGSLIFLSVGVALVTLPLGMVAYLVGVCFFALSLLFNAVAYCVNSCMINSISNVPVICKNDFSNTAPELSINSSTLNIGRNLGGLQRQNANEQPDNSLDNQKAPTARPKTQPLPLNTPTPPSMIQQYGML